jgi:2-phosphosulfolactate phosphatase
VSEPRVEHRQRACDVRCEWGAHGVALLARECAVVAIVDVLSFCTSVDVAVGRGARVLPQRWIGSDTEVDAAVARETAAHGAVQAGRRTGPGPSLRPSSLLDLAPGTLLALPSPNGASLCVAAARHGAVVFAGCLRNATAVATAARTAGGPIGLIPAGERWPDGTLRVAAEDALGAGGIVTALDSGWALSPEAELVAAQFVAAADRLPAVLSGLASGRELIADGYGVDVDLAAAHNVSTAAPRLVDGVLTG